MVSLSEPKSIVANFGEDLAFSLGASDEPEWAEYYKRLFPNLAYSAKVDADSPLQRMGIDRVLMLKSSREIFVDEKKRRDAWPDVLIELWSDLRRKKRGWSCDRNKVCDYVAYAVPKSKRCYMLPFDLLVAAVELHEKRWMQQYHKPKFDVPNAGWVTRNVPVPWGVLKTALTQQMNRRYSGEIGLPTLRKVAEDDAQMTFLVDAT